MNLFWYNLFLIQQVKLEKSRELFKKINRSNGVPQRQNKSLHFTSHANTASPLKNSKIAVTLQEYICGPATVRSVCPWNVSSATFGSLPAKQLEKRTSKPLLSIQWSQEDA